MPTFLFVLEEFEMFGKSKNFQTAKKDIIKSLKRDLDAEDFNTYVIKKFKKNPKRYLREMSTPELQTLRKNYLVLNSK